MKPPAGRELDPFTAEIEAALAAGRIPRLTRSTRRRRLKTIRTILLGLAPCVVLVGLIFLAVGAGLR